MRVLYSRTNFWFGLKAGGSVGHTVGVLTALSYLAQVNIISNELLYGIHNLPCEIVDPLVWPKGWKGEVLYNLYFARRLMAKMRGFLPDFVYHRYSGYSFATAKVCCQLQVPLILEFNSSDLWKIDNYEKGRRGIARRLRRLVLAHTELYNLRNASLIVVVSEALKKSLILRGLPAERILVNPNAVDVEKFKPLPPQAVERLKSDWGIPAGKIVVGFSGTFGQWHGVLQLTEAIRLLNGDSPIREKLFFFLIGDGELRSGIEAEVGHFDNVKFAGLVEYEHVQDYLSVCDVLLAPSTKLPDGSEYFYSLTKLFEYMAMEKGIVATRLGQMEQTLEDGYDAVLVEPGNVNDLARGILHLVERPDEIIRLGRNARQQAVQKHTWENNVSKTLAAFERISCIRGAQHT